MRKKIAILGSTGSIGTQALEVIKANPEEFEVITLTANENADLLIQQAIEISPDSVVIANESKYKYVKNALENFPIKVFAGQNAISQVVQHSEIETVLAAMVGFSGLLPVIKAVESGKNIALANKETLVVAGELITKLAIEKKVAIYPVDSEHSAIFQCLIGELYNPIEKIYLTASGGPFRGKNIDFLKQIKKEDALKHPNWEMGAKVTIDSASLMNKGLEAIEAKWLFDLKPEQIEVIIHPQSIIHSIVQFEDGSMKAQMGMPDMRLPIQYALGFPKRLKSNFNKFDFLKYPTLTFEQPQTDVFRNLTIALSALNSGGNTPCIMNAANEVVVDAFLKDKIGFLDMPEIIEKTISKMSFVKQIDLEYLAACDNESRKIAESLIS